MNKQPAPLLLSTGAPPMADAEMNRAVGRIEAITEKMAEDLKEHKEESREGRAKIYKEIETTRADTKMQLASLNEKIDALNTRIEKTEAKLGSYHDLSQQLKGSWKTIALAWLVIGGLVAYFWKVLLVKLGMG